MIYVNLDSLTITLTPRDTGAMNESEILVQVCLYIFHILILSLQFLSFISLWFLSGLIIVTSTSFDVFRERCITEGTEQPAGTFHRSFLFPFFLSCAYFKREIKIRFESIETSVRKFSSSVGKIDDKFLVTLRFESIIKVARGEVRVLPNTSKRLDSFRRPATYLAFFREEMAIDSIVWSQSTA